MLLIFALAGFGAAASVTGPPQPAAPTGQSGLISPVNQGPVIWEVLVGSQNDLSFSPEQIFASTGDTVEFTFFQNHTVTQSSLNNPCTPVAGGFNTGFNQYNPGTSGNVRVSFTVNSPEPQYFFCAQTDPIPDCQLGMVFAINAGSSMNTFLENVLANDLVSSTAAAGATGTTVSSSSVSASATIVAASLATSATDVLPFLSSLASLTASGTDTGFVLPTETGSGTVVVSSASTDFVSGGLQVTTLTSDVPVSSATPTSSTPVTTVESFSSVIASFSESTTALAMTSIIQTGASILSSTLAGGSITVVEAVTPSATVVATQLTSEASTSSSSIGKRAIATAETALGVGSTSKRSLAGGALIALAIAIGLAVIG